MHRKTAYGLPTGCGGVTPRQHKQCG